jgi:hypothetical protein
LYQKVVADGGIPWNSVDNIPEQRSPSWKENPQHHSVVQCSATNWTIYAIPIARAVREILRAIAAGIPGMWHRTPMFDESYRENTSGDVIRFRFEFRL